MELIEKMINLGVKATDSEVEVAGKRFHNIVLYTSLGLTIVSFCVLPIVYPQAKLYFFLYNTVNLVIIFSGLFLNSRNRFGFSANWTAIASATNIFVFSVLIFTRYDYVPFSLFLIVKLSVILLAIVTIFIQFHIKRSALPGVVVGLIYFYLFDVVYVKVYSVHIKEMFTLQDLYVFDFLFAIQFVFFIISYGVFVKQQRYYEAQIAEKNKKLEQAYSLVRQKKEVIEQNVDKASRFYQFILQRPDLIKDLFSDFYMLYEPAMYLSGDFYYFKRQGDKALILLADSMGHGISAALVSIFALGMLESKELELSSPEKLLSNLKQMFDNYRQIPWEVDVAFDIAILIYDAKTRKLEYSSVSIPVILVRDGEVKQLSYQRGSVSQLSKVSKFYRYSVQLLPGDVVYILTDGLVDLYKYLQLNSRSENFRSNLKKVCTRSFQTQRRYFGMVVRKCREMNFPIDDITLITFKVK